MCRVCARACHPELSQRHVHIVERHIETLCTGDVEVNVRSQRACELTKPQGQVDVLDRLHGGTLEQVVLGGDHNRIQAIGTRVETTRG